MIHFLTLVQYRTFQYFWDGAEPNSGMARERFHEDGVYPENDMNVVTSGGSGFGLMAILVGIERGFITRNEAVIAVYQDRGIFEKSRQVSWSLVSLDVWRNGKSKTFQQKRRWSRYCGNSLSDAGTIVSKTVFY